MPKEGSISKTAIETIYSFTTFNKGIRTGIGRTYKTYNKNSCIGRHRDTLIILRPHGTSIAKVILGYKRVNACEIKGRKWIGTIGGCRACSSIQVPLNITSIVYARAASSVAQSN